MVLESKYRRLLTYTRLSSLAYMYYYDKDGIEYREIKAALYLKDSQLSPQLLWLRKNLYASFNEQQFDDQKLSVYYITKEGKKAYNKIITWMEEIPLLQNLKKGVKDE